jgi:hypothetical protein
MSSPSQIPLKKNKEEPKDSTMKIIVKYSFILFIIICIMYIGYYVFTHLNKVSEIVKKNGGKQIIIQKSMKMKGGSCGCAGIQNAYA